MSTLPGGAADKAGLVHEALWGVHAMLQVVYGQAESITIEEPGLDGAEFFLLKGGKREYWQAKRQVLNQENWSLQRLKSEGVLDFFLDRAQAGESCVFASISDAPELRVLAENARDAKDCETFCNKFLGGSRRGDFTDLRNHWSAITESKAFSCLLLIRVEGARETTLESLLICLLAATFTGPAQTVMAVLQRLYVVSVHQTLTAEAIRKHLESHSIKLREFTLKAGLQDFLNGITDSYMAGQRAKLIRGQQISRKAALDIVSQLANSQQSTDVLIAGPAGGGKSGCLLQVVEGLRQAGLAVLAFRLDRIEPVASPEALGKQLDLPESPALVLTRAFKGKPVVLVVDQLDFVSTTSGRHPDFFDTIAALVDEIRGLRSFERIHLVLACRQFDFEHDYRLRRLLANEEQPILVGTFSNQEVADIIKADSGDPSRLSPKQLELLRLPQNLSLFIESKLAAEKTPGFVSQKELFDSYWNAKRRSVSANRPNEAGQWMQTIERLVDEMNARQELSVPKARLDAFSPQFLDVMVSEGVLTFDKRCYGFGHESFFDYCFARMWSDGKRDFMDFLEKDDQRLFRRAQLRQVLVYLRDDDHPKFLKNVRQALASKQTRPHLKLLVLDLLASFPNPYDDEFAVLLPYLESALNYSRKKESDPNRIAARALDIFVASRSLFIAADRLGYIKQWLHSGEPWLEDLMANYLRWQAEEHANRVAELIEPFVGKEDWKLRLRCIMEWASKEKGRQFFDLFLRLIDNGTLDNARAPIASNGTFWSMLGPLAKCRPVWFAEVAAHWLDRKVTVALATTGTEQGLGFDDEFGVQDFFECARSAPQEFLQHVVPAVLRAAQAFAYKEDTTLCHDGVWPGRYRSAHMGLKEAYLSCCETAIEIVGMDKTVSKIKTATKVLSFPPLKPTNQGRESLRYNLRKSSIIVLKVLRSLAGAAGIGGVATAGMD